MGLLDWFGKKKEADKIILEEGFCPNCWGRQEYQGKFKEAVIDKNKDVLSGDPAAQKAFVQKFVDDNLTGIRLKAEGGGLSCPSCKVRYKKGE